MNIQLDESQSAAVLTKRGEVLVVAGAGSGKTRVIEARVRLLLDEGVDPMAICCVTFTNAGAKVLRERLDGVMLGHCGTLHSLALRKLQEHGTQIGLPETVTVMDEETATELLNQCRDDLMVKTTDVALVVAVEDLRPGAEERKLKTGEKMDKVHTVALEYLSRQRQTGELDYDGLLWWFLKLVTKRTELVKYKHILVDEAQDSSELDWQIYERMREVAECRFMVGDDSQAIYGFRGGRVDKFLGFSQIANVYPLGLNYRSGKQIVVAAQSLINHNKDRIEHLVFSTPYASQGYVSWAQFNDANGELSWVANQIADSPPMSHAVLFRTNHLADQARDYLRGLGVVIAKTKGAKGVPDKGEREGRAALAFMANPWSDRAAEKLLRERGGEIPVAIARSRASDQACSVASLVNAAVPDVSKGWLTLSSFAALLRDTHVAGLGTVWLTNLATSLPDSFTLGDLLIAANTNVDEPEEAPGVHVGTVHSAKGREWDCVFLCGCEAEVWPGRDEEREARRLFYVGVTRAKERLVMTWCISRAMQFSTWKTEPRTRCKFVAETGVVL